MHTHVRNIKKNGVRNVSFSENVAKLVNYVRGLNKREVSDINIFSFSSIWDSILDPVPVDR